MRCTSCGQPAIALEPGGRCRQRAAIGKATKNDDGSMRYRWSCPGTLELVDREAKGGEPSCAREGCRNLAAITTARGEGVCSRCLAALAAIAEATVTPPVQGRDT